MRGLTRKALIAGVGLALVGGGLAALPSSAATGGGACQLHGTADFAPNGPGLNAGPFGYSFSGDLTNCFSSDAMGPAVNGTISSGKQITINGIKYQEPASTGNGSCANGTTEGVAIVQWADGKTTIVKYSTNTVGAAVALSGNVIPSTTLKAVDGTSPDAVVTSNAYAGDTSQGALVFEVTDPTQCNSAGGVQSAGIDGVVGIGSYT